MTGMLDNQQDETHEESMLDAGNKEQDKGCMVCGQHKPIAAGSLEDGYECKDCWSEHGTTEPARKL